MNKKKREELEKNEIKETVDTSITGNNGSESGKQAGGEPANSCEDTREAELEVLRAQLDEKTRQCDEYFNLVQRKAAEFDNYRKRTAKEKEALYTETICEAVAAFLPVLDNLERAIQASDSTEDKSLKTGVELVYRQMLDVLKNLGVETIKCVGENFDPTLHNAVMHIDDDAYGENEIVEEFQKGYKLQDKVIRYSVVKVAN